MRNLEKSTCKSAQNWECASPSSPESLAPKCQQGELQGHAGFRTSCDGTAESRHPTWEFWPVLTDVKLNLLHLYLPHFVMPSLGQCLCPALHKAYGHIFLGLTYIEGQRLNGLSRLFGHVEHGSTCSLRSGDLEGCSVLLFKGTRLKRM